MHLPEDTLPDTSFPNGETLIRKGLTVLLADDDDNDLILARRVFERIQRRTKLVTVPAGEVAIAYLLGEGEYSDRQNCPLPDVVILDHRMPRLCGLSVLSWLRSEARFVSMPVLILSLSLLPSEMDAVTRLGAAWRKKPVDGDEMLRAIQDGIIEACQRVGRPA